MTSALPDRAVWDEDGQYEAALLRLIRAHVRGTGCRMTPQMVAALHFSEGDGDYFQSLMASQATPHPHPEGSSH